jgi:hypothetical protein
LSVFLVSPSGSLSNYTTIGSAYAAAKAAGAGATTYAKVLVCPGIYTEDLTMDRPGIDIVAVAPHRENELADNQAGGTILRGQLTIDLSDTPGAGVLNRCQWIGIDIEPNAGTPTFPLFEFSGATEQYATVADCQITHTTSSGAVIAGVSNSASSEVNFVRTNIFRDFAGSTALFGALSITGSLCKVNDCRVAAQPFGDGDFGASVVTGASGLLQALGSRFFGRISGDGAASFDRCTVGATIIDTATSGAVSLTKCTVSRVLSGSWVIGTGSFTYDSLTWSFASQANASIGSSVSVTQTGSLPPGQPYLAIPFGTAFTIAGQTAILADDSGGAKAIGMPLADRQLGPIRVKGTGGPGPLTLTPSGGDTINGVAGPFVVPAAGVTLVSNGTSSWESFG